MERHEPRSSACRRSSTTRGAGVCALCSQKRAVCGCRRRTSSPPCSPRNQLESRVKPCVRMRSARLGFSSETNSTRNLSLAPGLAVSCLITKVPSVQAHPHTLCHPLRHVNRPSPVRALSVQSQSLLYSPILVLLIRKKNQLSTVSEN